MARKINNLNKCSANRTRMLRTAKEYRKTLKFYKRKENEKFQNKLQKMKSKRPKDFGKVINSLSKNTRNEYITLDKLFVYFKDINDGQEETVNEDTDDFNEHKRKY